jgi:hypothetical protein
MEGVNEAENFTWFDVVGWGEKGCEEGRTAKKGRFKEWIARRDERRGGGGEDEERDGWTKKDGRKEKEEE